MEIKCPICGSQEIIKYKDEEYYAGHGITGYRDGGYICSSCGFIMKFDQKYVPIIKSIELEIKKVEFQKQSFIDKVDSLKSQSFDRAKYETKIEETKKEIDQLKTLNVGGHDIEIRLHSISEFERIIKESKDPEIENQIKNYEIEISNINKQLHDLQQELKNKTIGHY